MLEYLLLLAALVLALIHEFQAQGKSILGWAVVFIAIVLALPLLK
jgi:hypothetical protein